MLTQTNLCEKIERLLRPLFPNDTVDVSPSAVEDNVHVVVVSRSFDGLDPKEREEKLWSVIDRSDLPEEDKAKVTLLLAYSPTDLK